MSDMKTKMMLAASALALSLGGLIGGGAVTPAQWDWAKASQWDWAASVVQPAQWDWAASADQWDWAASADQWDWAGSADATSDWV